MASVQAWARQMMVKEQSVVTYRDLAKRWEERADLASSLQGRGQCEELAEAYRSLVATLDEAFKPLDPPA